MGSDFGVKLQLYFQWGLKCCSVLHVVLLLCLEKFGLKQRLLMWQEAELITSSLERIRTLLWHSASSPALSSLTVLPGFALTVTTAGRWRPPWSSAFRSSRRACPRWVVAPQKCLQHTALWESMCACLWTGCCSVLLNIIKLIPSVKSSHAQKSRQLAGLP